MHVRPPQINHRNNAVCIIKSLVYLVTRRDPVEYQLVQCRLTYYYVNEVKVNNSLCWTLRGLEFFITL